MKNILVSFTSLQMIRGFTSTSNSGDGSASSRLLHRITEQEVEPVATLKVRFWHFIDSSLEIVTIMAEMLHHV